MRFSKIQSRQGARNAENRVLLNPPLYYYLVMRAHLVPTVERLARTERVNFLSLYNTNMLIFYTISIA